MLQIDVENDKNPYYFKAFRLICILLFKVSRDAKFLKSANQFKTVRGVSGETAEQLC